MTPAEQHKRFEEISSQLGCADVEEAAFDEYLKKIAKAKSKKPDKNGLPAHEPRTQESHEHGPARIARDWLRIGSRGPRWVQRDGHALQHQRTIR
jgi:hypothetical protein